MQLFKRLSDTRAVLTNKRTDSIGRRIFAIIVTAMVCIAGLGLKGAEIGFVLNWACGALFSWHLLFCQRKVEIDLGSTFITTTISSVYPIAKQKISIDSIKAFRVDKDIGRKNGYKLVIIFDETKAPYGFSFGSLSSMSLLASQLSAFCNKPLIEMSVP
ncbi:hypothetical protein [Shewanella donghaensis]|uniref:hypothetical protein n=1 Tax=Shewanella donghaensis TaxID=238836 RepID=UPI001184609D|nr:hypothetical protein [Shewanella donghaensis]